MRALAPGVLGLSVTVGSRLVTRWSLNLPQPGPGTVEFEPPLACTKRLLKSVLPPSTNLGRDAGAAFTRAAGVFVIYLTACANDVAKEKKRQTITANDVVEASRVSTCMYIIL